MRTIVKEIAKAFIERSNALGLKGKKREDAAMHFFCGAGNALRAGGETQTENFNRVNGWIQFMLQFRGYRAVVEEAAEPPPRKTCDCGEGWADEPGHSDWVAPGKKGKKKTK
jgi:hypothetical protein